ncbi:MAG: biotin/lipoyl-binding protein [Verrucomicrobiales bacterium]|nr:biotin/lipoyl-binding protein [Verrucomicrobiales bacterium]
MRGTLNLKPGVHWLAAGLAVVWLAGSGCTQRPFGKSKENPAPDAAAMAVPVEVAAIRRGAIEAVQKTSRHLEAEQEVRVYARTANRVTKLLVEEGDRVEQGQVLVQLEDDIQTTQAEKARGSVERARREFARLEALYAQRLISEQVYSDSQFELRQLELALECAAAVRYTRVVSLSPAPSRCGW